MKILVLADDPAKSLWDYFDGSKLKDIDMIISCGDLPAAYLEFLVTMVNCPVLYVHGNHDTSYEKKTPEGCVCIEDKVYVHEGIRIFGLGGSMRYNRGEHQYTEKEMQQRIRKKRLKLWRKKGVDIFVTHAPARGLGDQEDIAHRGFQAFTDFLEKYKPKYMVHGHVHMNYGYNIQRTTQYHETTVVNAYEKYIIEI